MKKILIALPLVLVMLLSMIPVMAADQVNVPITVKYYEQPDSATPFKTRTQDEKIDKAIASDKDKLEAEVAKIVAGWGFPHDKTTWTVKVTAVPYKEAVVGKTETYELTMDNVKALFPKADLTKAPAGAVGIAKAAEDKFKDKTAEAVIALEEGNFAVKPENGENPELAQFVKTTKSESGQEAKAEADVKPDCKTEKDKEPTCVTPCSEITVKLHDVHNNKFLDAYQETFKVDDRIAPDYQSILDIYLRDFFPWKTYQPLKNYLNVYSILTPKNLTDCEIIIEVLPKFEKVQIIHELYDCCITPDGKVKEDLAMSFIEDDQAFLFTGVPDGFMGIPFLEFHTGLMVNQDKAAEYAKTRLEKVNATDFVFQKATFYDGIKTSAYVKGVVNMTTGKVTPILNDVPTIVIKYLRGECVKNEQKVDNAKVEAGVQTTTNAPAQQLPATGAKDITAFFMSAVALLGLGIFFAKKH